MLLLYVYLQVNPLFYFLDTIYAFFSIKAVERRRTMLRERARQKEAEKVPSHYYILFWQPIGVQ